MEIRSPSSSNTAEKNDNGNLSKQAACLNCRRSKTRCLRNPGDIKCKKCTQTQAECLIPEYRVGRKKGIKNKRDGLEKAVYRIEQAIKKSKTQHSQSEDDENILHLRNLVTEAQQLLPQQNSNLDPSLRDNPSSHLQTPNHQSHLRVPRSLPGADRIEHHVPEDNFAFDDAENPLQLLARASDLSTPKNLGTFGPSLAPWLSNLGKDEDLRSFFGPFRPSLDVGPDIDPIDMGLVTAEEAKNLFAYFYEHLAHTRWGLDPLLHTPEFVRKHSAFLFTSIMSVSALFIPSAGAVSKRLSGHCKKLAHHVMTHRNRSPEIVLAYMVNIPWMAPGKHWSDDETCSYMASSLTIAMDLSLNKLIVPSPSDSLSGVHDGIAPSDCISARKALDLDGFSDVDPSSDLGQRLLRRRERIWLALFVLDRGVCLARGRSFTVPSTTLIENCDRWHLSSIADLWDGSIISSTVLRRDLANVISEVKETCDGNRGHIANSIVTAESLQQMIDGFFHNWYETWAFAIGGTKDNCVPPYVEILVTHGRLSIYSSVVNHPSAPHPVKTFFRSAGLSSALNVLRASVQGESRLRSMPNNTAIMISFAACFAFYLSVGSGQSGLAPSIRRLIEESADVLERIGTVTPQRCGTSRLYGRWLRVVVGSSPPASSTPQQQTQHQMVQQLQPLQYGNGNQDMQMNELLQFSAMSDDQINEAIRGAGDGFDGNMGVNWQWQGEEKTGLDWLDWFNLDVGVG